ncbi:MAG: hypothetical protein CVU38_19855, partial [Chloroflexi bacterium HGW-Chloroflexi-1]
MGRGHTSGQPGHERRARGRGNRGRGRARDPGRGRRIARRRIGRRGRRAAAQRRFRAGRAPGAAIGGSPDGVVAGESPDRCASALVAAQPALPGAALSGLLGQFRLAAGAAADTGLRRAGGRVRPGRGRASASQPPQRRPRPAACDRPLAGARLGVGRVADGGVAHVGPRLAAAGAVSEPRAGTHPGLFRCRPAALERPVAYTPRAALVSRRLPVSRPVCFVRGARAALLLRLKGDLMRKMTDQPPRRIAVNSGYLLIAYGIEAVLSLLLLSLVARYLDQAGFGRYGYVISFIELFIMLTELSSSRVQIREMASDLTHAEKPLSDVWTLRLGLSLAMLIIVMLAAPGLRSDPELWWSIVLFAVGQVLFVLGEIFNSVYRAYQQMRYQTYTVIAGQVLITLLCVPAILF